MNSESIAIKMNIFVSYLTAILILEVIYILLILNQSTSFQIKINLLYQWIFLTSNFSIHYKQFMKMHEYFINLLADPLGIAQGRIQLII